MASKILILSADDAAIRLATGIVASLGGIVAAERSPEAALDRLVGGEADLAVIDLDLPGALRVADGLQRREEPLPVVLLATSERQEQVKEDGQRREPVVGKPLRAEELREVVGHALAPSLIALTPGPAFAPAPLPSEGSLRERPVHVVLGELSRRRSSGRLDLESGAFKARIHLDGGSVVWATSTDPHTLAGYAEVAQGSLSREHLEAALARVRAERVPLHEALRLAFPFDEAGLRSALARQAASVVIRACALPDGSWSFMAGEAPPLVAARHNALGLAVAGVRKAYPATTIRAWLDRHREERLAAHPEMEPTLAAAGLATGVPAAIAGGATAGELIGRLSEADLALLFALAGFALVRFAPAHSRAQPGHDPAAGPVSPKTRNAAPRGPALTGAERQAVEAEDHRTAAASHYEVLGLPPDAAPAAVKQAYFAAAKRWHSDSFAARDLGGLAPAVERIFARISEAHAVLADPAKRAEYDVFLERKAKGLPTDVAAVLRAEETFLKAQALFRTQRYADAEALLRQAVELNPAEAEFWAYLGASAYRARGKAAVQEAREAFARARALIPQSLVTEYLEAQLEIGEGELDAAERRLRKILVEKPDHMEAQRELRALRERKEREPASGRGLLGTLWKRK